MKNVGILKFALMVALATSQLSFGMAAKPTAKASRAVNCPTCFETGVPAQLHGNHAVCVACLGDQIEAAHRNRNAGDKNRMLKCPIQNCQHDITLPEVQRILPNHVAQFQQIQQAHAKKLADADKAIRDAAAQKKVVENEQDRSNLLWKYKNTKPCPHCKTAIEKNSGCKWVNCTQCRREFCFTCLTPSPVGAENHFVHKPCHENDIWKSERTRLETEHMRPLIIGAVLICAAVWGISELYEYIKAKKAKKAELRKQAAARYGVPGRQQVPVDVY